MSVIKKLEILSDKGILHYDDGEKIILEEGKQSVEAKARWIQIKKKFSEGYFESVIENAISNPNQQLLLKEKEIVLLEKLVNSISSEVGRAIVGLSILQLCIKSICSEQSIRLHKGGGKGNLFSWKEGISMRTLDSHFITPVLRHYGLLSLNLKLIATIYINGGQQKHATHPTLNIYNKWWAAKIRD